VGLENSGIACPLLAILQFLDIVVSEILSCEGELKGYINKSICHSLFFINY
jgi:hypothetical protein